MNKRISILLLLIVTIGCIGEQEVGKSYQNGLADSVIELVVNVNAIDTLYAEALVITNIPRGSNRSETLTILEPGTYYLNIRVDRPTSCTLYLDTEHNIIVNPNDTTQIQVLLTGGKAKVSFVDQWAEINKYYLDKKNHLGYTDIRRPINARITSKTTFSSIKQVIDSIAGQELIFLDKYLSTNSLPKWFLNFEKAQIMYMRDDFKTSLPHTNQILELFEDTLPEGYFAYLNDVEIDNPDAILSSHYMWFLDGYFNMDLPVDSFKDLGGRSRVSLIITHQLNRTKKELKGLVKDTYNRYNFSSIIRYYSDSIAIDSIAKEFGLTNYSGIVTDTKVKTRSGGKRLNLQKGDTIPNFYLVDRLDSLVEFREFKDEILYLNFWATWCGPCIKNFPELNTLISHYDNNNRIRFINICIGSKKSAWISSITKYQLKGTNLFAEGNWSSKLKSIFNINGVPHYVIIDNNNVLYENFSAKAPSVQAKLDELLRNTTTRKTPWRQ